MLIDRTALLTLAAADDGFVGWPRQLVKFLYLFAHPIPLSLLSHTECRMSPSLVPPDSGLRLPCDHCRPAVFFTALTTTVKNILLE